MSFPELNPKIVLCVGAHPDDIDGHAGGSVAKWIAGGAKVYYLILTRGGRGSGDPLSSTEEIGAIRQAEQITAAKVFGVTDVFFSDYPDGELENSHDVKREIVRYIRQLQPDCVVGWDPHLLYSATHGFINHHDHVVAGKATLEAVYPLARNVHSYPELLEEGLDPYTVETVLLLTLADHYNYAEDVSEYMAAKLEAMHTHGSQSGNALEKMVLSWASEIGAQQDCTYAEPFIRIDIKI